MDDLLNAIQGGGSQKPTNPTIIQPSMLGRRNYRVFYRGAAFVFGLMTFLALGNIYEGVRVFRYVLYFALVAFTLFYKNPKLFNPQPRLMLGFSVCAVTEMITLLLLAGG